MLDNTDQSPTGRLRILSATDVDSILSTLEPSLALDSQKRAFVAHSTGTAQTPNRLTTNTDVTWTLYMPSQCATAGGTACKIVSGGTGARRLRGSTIVLDDETGAVKGVINSSKLTALRNASGSALFLSLCPVPSRPLKSLLIFGSGAQAQAHAELILRLNPSIDRCTFVVRAQTSRSSALVSSIQLIFPSRDVSLSVATSPKNDGDIDGFSLRQAVREADIICTLTPSHEALFNTADVSPGTRLVLVGSYTPNMREVDAEMIKRAGIVVVDGRDAAMSEAGELIDSGITCKEMLELGEVLSDIEGMRGMIGKGGDVFLFKSVGLGVQDVSIASLILSLAEEHGIGSVVEGYDR